MNKTLIALSAVLLLSPIAILSAQAENPGVMPIKSRPHGMTYGEWAGEWWRWLSETPTTDVPCTAGPSGATDRVWFLGGQNDGQPIRAECELPPGSAIFLPVINEAYFTFTTDPAEERTEEFLKSVVPGCGNPTDIEIVIDGDVVTEPEQYFVEHSPLFFDIELVPGNIFGIPPEWIPEGIFPEAIASGYWLFLHPLSVGEHTVSWTATWECNYSPEPITTDASYDIVVAR